MEAKPPGACPMSTGCTYPDCRHYPAGGADQARDLMVLVDSYRHQLLSRPLEPNETAETYSQIQRMARVLAFGADEWKNEAATLLARFISLSATPDRDGWSNNASCAIQLLTGRWPDQRHLQSENVP